MPPRASLTGSFSVTDANNEVVCPLKNSDGSACRKRCIGEKRYRSMQEHIRRAHPEHYIPKLPATEESFILMINTPPSERPPLPQPAPASAIVSPHQPHPQQPPPLPAPPVVGAYPQQNGHALSWDLGADFYEAHANDLYMFQRDDYGPQPGGFRSSDEYRRGSLLPAANAAEALAQLHSHRPDVTFAEDQFFQDAFSENDQQRPRSQFGPVEIDPQIYREEFLASQNSSRPRELHPSPLARSPPYPRSSTLPPLQRTGKPNRPRKSSVTERARLAKHERRKSRDKDWSSRLSHDRKAMSAEPQNAAALYGKRWEDLIDAAASATEEDSRDLTPVPSSPRPSSQHITNSQNRNSLPPFLASSHHFTANSYQASPLQQTLTPPPPEMPDLQPFPSVESSIDSKTSGHQSTHSGQNFHIPPTGLADSSPAFSATTHAIQSAVGSGGLVQIYCAGCHKLSILKDSYACTECICGLCKDCVDALSSEQSRRRLAGCPRCAAIGGKFKPFQLDIR